MTILLDSEVISSIQQSKKELFVIVVSVYVFVTRPLRSLFSQFFRYITLPLRVLTKAQRKIKKKKQSAFDATEIC